jgi:hypothetical protein
MNCNVPIVRSPTGSPLIGVRDATLVKLRSY